MSRYPMLACLMVVALSAGIPQGRGYSEGSARGAKAHKAFVSARGEVAPIVITPQDVMRAEPMVVEGPASVIIQMREEPILAKKWTLAATTAHERAGRLQEHHDRLASAQSTLKAWIKAEEPGIDDRTFRHYRFAFNGMAATVSPGTLKKLKQRPDVLKVFRDERAKALLADSVPLIGAPQMWNTYGADGQGMRVAVIDTGIDYTHPDLGGGFGSGFKVIGGYDFVNGDADPFDDHGHGTHVAGIVAANGTLKGVAPGAKLMAYKVLDAGGSGSFSAIIAAIDRAVDPDQNPATNDGAHVINLSLGGPGDPEDPLSQAVDTAVNAGVVCAVAAGNSGSPYSTLGSPGCARKALTVGASDLQDRMAWFSSRGPSQPDLGLKPDLTAPGVEIRSAKPGGGYQSMSGTSMATPHVAGAVALLLQLHPTWTPDVVKAVLAEKAKDLGEDAFTQGSGRIQVVASHLAKAVMVPNNLSFGLVDADQGTWTKSLKVRIQNMDAASRTYTLGMQEDSPAGATWSISPSTLPLGAGQSQEVTLTLTVDNGTLPYAPPPTLAYGAKLVAAAPDDTLTVPVVFYKAAQLELVFDKAPWTILLFDQNADPEDGFHYAYKSNLPHPSFLLPPRKYDVICQYLIGPHEAPGASVIVREGIEARGKKVLNISLDQEAVHHATFIGRDADGKDVASLAVAGASATFTHASGMGSGFGGGWVSDFYFSTASPAYGFDLVLSGWSREGETSRYHEFKYALKEGIAQGGTFRNPPGQRVKLKARMEPGIDSIWVDSYRYVNRPGIAIGDSIGWFANPGSPAPWVLTPPFEMEADLSPMPYPTFPYNQSRMVLRRYAGGTGPGEPLMKSGLLGIPDLNTLNVHHFFQPDTPFYTTHSARLVLGEPPHAWTGKLLMHGTGAWLGSAHAFGGTPLYLDQAGGGTTAPLSFELIQGASVVGSGPILSTGDDLPAWASLTFAPGAYTLKVPFDAYGVNGQPGHVVASMAFDTTQADGAPPFLKYMRILTDGEITSSTREGRSNQLGLLVEDEVGLAQVQALYQTTGDWIPLPLPLPSGPTAEFRVDLPPDLPQGPVNLKLMAADGAGNRLDQEWVPAFVHLTGPIPELRIQPGFMGCFPGDAADFTATVNHPTDTRVIWAASAGSIDASGRFTAPNAPGLVRITATSVADPTQSATATVTVRGTDFDGNTASNPQLLGLANAVGSTAPADLAKYDFNGDSRIDDADLEKLFTKMGW